MSYYIVVANTKSSKHEVNEMKEILHGEGCKNNNEFSEMQQIEEILSSQNPNEEKKDIQSCNCWKANDCNNSMSSNSTIKIGTVRTGAPGTCATVTNSGTSTNAVFNFMIPRGVDGVSSINTDSACSKAQMRNVLSQIIDDFKESEVTLTFYDGSRVSDLQLLNAFPDRNPVFVLVNDLNDSKERIFTIDNIAEVSILTNNNIPNIRYLNCNNRFTNPLEAMLSCAKTTELVLSGFNLTDCCICNLVDGMIVSKSNCPERINYTASASLIGVTSNKKNKN